MQLFASKVKKEINKKNFEEQKKKISQNFLKNNADMRSDFTNSDIFKGNIHINNFM